MNLRSKYIYIIAMLPMAVFLPAGCTDDDLSEPVTGQYTDRVCFSTATPAFEPDTRSGADMQPGNCFVLHPETSGDSLFVNTSICNFDTPDSSATRATLTTSDSFNSFVVSAFAKNNGSWVSFFSEEENTRGSAGAPWVYTSGNVHYWPGADHPMRFCAYSPSKADGLQVNHSMTGGVPNTLSFTVQGDVSKQVDLLTAKADEVAGDYNSTYPLSFNHACTAVQFKEGADMQPGTISKVELMGVRYKGVFSFETMSWTLDDTDLRDFAQNLTKSVPGGEGGTAITDDSECFVMLPQTLPEGAQLRISFKDHVTDTERVMTASLAGMSWPQGKRVVYTISITPDYKFEFVEASEPIDAHYDIIYKTLRVSGVPDGKPWTLTASLSATDNENVSLQLQSEMNEYARMGYWLDRKIDANNRDTGSARGEITLKGTGSGDFPIAIFVPENITGATRDVIINASFDGTDLTAQKLTLQQLSPALSPDGSFGWEQIDDNEQGEFGFCWNARYMYLIPYARSVSDKYFPNEQTKGHQLSESLIERYNASSFVKNYDNIRVYGEDNRITWITIIDYSRLNVTSTTYSDNDGLYNTNAIIQIGRGAFSKLFQNALLSLTKENAGETNDTKTQGLFRAPNEAEITNRWNNQEFDWETEHDPNLKGLFITRFEGDQMLEPGTSVWSYLGTRNAYNLTQSTTVTGAYVWTPTIKELKWYLPAKDQFNSQPTTVKDPIYPSDCWTSTPIKNTSDAYLGSGSEEPRVNKHKVRACRNIR